jgi:membrane dipeptidase
MIVDAHLDLAYNALVHGRELGRPVAEVRQAESKLEPAVRGRRGTALVTLPELKAAGVGLIFGTLFVGPAGHPLLKGEPAIQYETPDQAFELAQRQLDYYHRVSDAAEDAVLVGDANGLDEVVAAWRKGEERSPGKESLGDAPLGIVPLMEGADPIRDPAEAELWYERGLRIVGLAWDDTRYSAGAWRDSGGLTMDGRQLLEVMADLGFILDLTHMSEMATLEALEMYEGPVIASHSNARALVPGNRQLSDEQIRRLAEREGVIGVALFNAFLKAGHRYGESREAVSLAHVVAHIDHICQCVGDASHVGIGSDFDGGFGLENIPADLDGVSGLSAIGQALSERGYDPADVAGIMGGNWVALLRRSWGEAEGN